MEREAEELRWIAEAEERARQRKLEDEANERERLERERLQRELLAEQER